MRVLSQQQRLGFKIGDCLVPTDFHNWNLSCSPSTGNISHSPFHTQHSAHYQLHRQVHHSIITLHYKDGLLQFTGNQTRYACLLFLQRLLNPPILPCGYGNVLYMSSTRNLQYIHQIWHRSLLIISSNTDRDTALDFALDVGPTVAKNTADARGSS